VRKNKKNKIRLVLCFALSLVMFFSLLQVESTILKKQEKQWVYVAKTDIIQGMVITKENEEIYFERQEAPRDFVTDNAVKSIEELVDRIAGISMRKNQIIQKDYLIQKNSVLSKMKNPIEIGIKMENIAQAVGGLLREGDVIDVSVVNITNNECTKVLSNVYVTKAIAANGAIIPREDCSTSALSINLIIDQSQEGYLNEQLALGTVRTSKIDVLHGQNVS